MSFAKTSKRVDGNKLRQIRESIGWTQQQAALRSGYSCRLIRKLEAGGPVEQKTLRDVLDAYREHDSAIAIGEHDRYLDPESDQSVGPLAIDWLRSLHQKNGERSDDGVLSPAIVLLADGRDYQGRHEVRNRYAHWLAAIGPAEFQIDHIVADSAAVSAYWTLTCGNSRGATVPNAVTASKSIRGSTLLLFQDRQIVLVREHSEQARMV